MGVACVREGWHPWRMRTARGFRGSGNPGARRMSFFGKSIGWERRAAGGPRVRQPQWFRTVTVVPFGEGRGEEAFGLPGTPEPGLGALYFPAVGGVEQEELPRHKGG